MSDEDEMYFSSSSDLEDDHDSDMVDGTQESDSESSPMEDNDIDDDDDYAFDVPSVSKAKGKGKASEVDSRELTADQLEKTMTEDAEYVSTLSGTTASSAIVLLRSLQWNKERLIEKFMDDPDRVMAAAGVVDSPSTPSAVPGSPVLSPNARRTPRAKASSRSRPTLSRSQTLEKFMCPICCDEDATNALSLGCAHAFCSDCWNTYLHTKIREEGEVAIRCMDESCSIQANDAFVRKAASAEDAKRYVELLVRDYVASTSSVKFCPWPGCTHAISCPAASRKGALETIVPTVTCSQVHPETKERHVFCFGCGTEKGHSPLTCRVSKMWLKKCADDSETANWIKSNTKECTKCQSTIEKNGGCNHMTCKKCKHEFCWVCMGDWAAHGSSWYNCNRFDEKDAQDARDQQSKSRASLERYLHYYNRWANHEQSARLSLELYAKMERKMEEMQTTSDLTWIEVQFAKKAVDEVMKCRHTLKWTYAMAYFLNKGNMKEMFEDIQADLEKAVEDLSELLEMPIEPENIPDLRQRITNKTVYVAKRNEIVLDDTAKGFAEGRWEFNKEMVPPA